MRIGIEAQRIFRLNKHGMDYVVLQEIKELQKLDTLNEYFIFVKDGPDKCVEETANFHIVVVNAPSYPLWEQWALPKAARKCQLDLLHCTSNTAPIRCSIPLVLTLHDIIFLEPRDRQNKSLYQNLGFEYRRLVVPKILDKCLKIITVSNFEKDNIVGKLSLPPSKIEMIYNGYNKWFQPISDVKEVCSRYIRHTGYFLFLGNTDPKKNTERTLIAYSQYVSKGGKRMLLVADLNRAIIDDILRRNHIENVGHRIITPGYIQNSDLPYIYNGAFAFLYTSLRESFGIPLLEAMSCGTPVITGDRSALPEIAADGAVLVDPEDPSAIAKAMLRLEKDNGYREEIIHRGLRRCEAFSWEYTARNLLNLYNTLG